MKFLIALITLTSSLHAFAGPEEHKQAQSCYTLSEADRDRVYEPAMSRLPDEICLEAMSFNGKTSAVSVTSYFQPELFKEIHNYVAVEVQGGGFQFMAVSPFKKFVEADCGKSDLYSLTIAGYADTKNNVDVKKLKVYVERLVTNNMCTAPATKLTYSYELL